MTVTGPTAAAAANVCDEEKLEMFFDMLKKPTIQQMPIPWTRARAYVRSGILRARKNGLQILLSKAQVGPVISVEEELEQSLFQLFFNKVQTIF